MQQSLEILNSAVNDWLPEPRPVSRPIPALELEQMLDLSLGQAAENFSELKKAVKEYLYYTPDAAAPEFCKLLYSGRNEPALLGDWVTSLANATMHTYQVSPVATLMELELIRQWNRLIGFDTDTRQGDGVMVAGGSQANLISMMLARHRACPDLQNRGNDGRTLVAFVSDQAHYSSLRAANVLGIGMDNLRTVASDDAGRLCPEDLKRQIEASLAKGEQPFYLCLTAGTTVLGAFDPVAECSDIAREHGLWLHIDGAWGAPVLFSEQHRHLLEDSHLADSFAWDAHKFMNVPITAAVILVREPGLLQQCCSGGGGDYLFHQDVNAPYNLGERSIQCGRRADALKVWLSWKAMGHQGYANKVDQLMVLKQQTISMIEGDTQLQQIGPADYLNILFRFKPEGIKDESRLRQLNIEISKAMVKSGGAYIDYASYKGQTGIRLILANDELRSDHIHKIIEQCKQIGNRLVAS